MELKKARSVFAALAEAIVYQQLSNKAAATIYGRVEALYPRARQGFTPAHILRTPDAQAPRRRHLAAQAQVAARPRAPRRRPARSRRWPPRAG